MQKIVLLIIIGLFPSIVFSQTKLSKKVNADVVNNVIQLLNDNYVYPDTALKMGNFLSKQLKNGAYDNIIKLQDLSDLINRDLNIVHHDGHLQLQYNPQLAADFSNPTDNTTTNVDPLKRIRDVNFGLNKVENLNGNIGYLNIAKFWADDIEGRETLKGALKFLRNSNAIIIDVRNCGGGSPETVKMICGYFLEKKTHLNDSYSRPSNKTTEYWTVPDTSFRDLVKMPLYVLTSNGTFSAAEEFCYDLQNLKRATIIGEQTGGGAHNTFERPVVNGFVLYIPYGRAINPITKTNWEKVGVSPDIKVASSKALETAEMMIFESLILNTKDESEKFNLNWQLDLLKAINNPIVIDDQTLIKYSGVYEQRTFTFENGKLYYQRTGKPKFELEAMTKTILKGKGNTYFKIEFIENNQGVVDEVKAYYQDNRIEVSKRNK